MTANRQRGIYVGTFVYCQTPTKLKIFQGYVLVGIGGKIDQAVETGCYYVPTRSDVRQAGWTDELEHIKVVKAGENEFFFPGFIDTHIHAPQYPNSGLFGKTTLLDWLKIYTYPMEASLSDLEKAKKVYETCVSTTLSHGTTTAAYYATIHVKATNLLATICHEKRQRALIGRICMDHPSALVDYYRDENVETSHAATIAVIDHIRSIDEKQIGPDLKPILTPRSAVSCTTEEMHMLRDLANNPEYPIRIQTHLSENLGEMKLVRKMWPSHENYTAVYDAHGLLTSKTILAHAIHLDESERKCIADRGAKVSHCPVSNSALGSGMCRVRQLLDSGITVGLGTDISGGYSASVLEASRQACLISRLVAAEVEKECKSENKGHSQENTTDNEIPEWDRVKLSVEESLGMATRGGAEVVGWQDKLGAFEQNMCFDAQLISFDLLDSDDSPDKDLGNFKVFGWENWEDRIAKWVYCGDDRNTTKVWVDGYLVHTR